MRGRTITPISGFASNSGSYVQINIYDTSLKGLREDGVDIKHMLQHIGYRSVVMDVPILSQCSQKAQCCPRRIKSFGEFHCQPRNLNNNNQHSVITRETFEDCEAVARTKDNELIGIPLEYIQEKDLDASKITTGNEHSPLTTPVLDFDVYNGQGEGKGFSVPQKLSAPLTSTPIPEKHNAFFKAFIVDKSTRGSHEVAYASLYTPSPCIESSGVRKQLQNNTEDPSEEISPADDQSLFQDCREEFENELDCYFPCMKHFNTTEVHPLIGSESVMALRDTSAAHDDVPISRTESRGRPFVPDVVESDQKDLLLVTSHDMNVMTESIKTGDATVADVSFETFSREVAKRLQSDDERSTIDMNTAELCSDSVEHSLKFHPSSEEVTKLPQNQDLNTPNAVSAAKDFNQEFIGGCEIGKTNWSIPEVYKSEDGEQLNGVEGITAQENYSEELWSNTHAPSKELNKASLSKEFVNNDFTNSSNVMPKKLATKSQEFPQINHLKRMRSASCGSENSNDNAKECHKIEADESKCQTTSGIVENRKVFRCHMEGCGKNLLWRPRYGKNRLVDHVRTHWDNAVKVCKLCDFKASSLKKVYRHHRTTHVGIPYMGATSIETKEDMEELLQLWKLCFPDAKDDEFCDPQIRRCFKRRSPLFCDVTASGVSNCRLLLNHDY